MGLYTCIYTDSSRGQSLAFTFSRGQKLSLESIAFYLFFFFSDIESVFRLDSLALKSLGSASPLPAPGLQVCATNPDLYIGSGDLTSGPHACAEHTPPTESSVQPNPIFLDLEEDLEGCERGASRAENSFRDRKRPLGKHVWQDLGS